MGQQKIKMPSSPSGWAIHLSLMVKAFKEAHGLDRFPIDVASIAREYTAHVFPDTPITIVDGQKFSSRKFEGALIPKPDKSGEWGIFYNSAITSSGRINFTLGHELGHYLLHRQLSGEPIYCAKSDMWSWDSAYGKMEAEANQFASYLLMPLDDFREQIKGLNKPTVQNFEEIRQRYDVSLTATILKWLEITSKRAMIVVSNNGFIDWSWSSKPLIRSNVYFRARQVTTPLPELSLANGGTSIPNPEVGTVLPAGIWAEKEDVYESVIFSEYHDMAISLLIYPNDPPFGAGKVLAEYEEETVPDSFDRFSRN